MDRRILVALVALVAVLAAAVGWFAGQRIKSPAEIAAEQEPPPPSLITVPVELRTLSQNVVVRGTVRPSDQTELAAPATGGPGIVTALSFEGGDEIAEGDVLVEVDGRPVIALQGALPAFRNLIPSLEGADVEQLEEALVRLGYDPGDVDGVYTSVTAEAVAALYRDRGYTPPDSSDTDRSALRSAEDVVDSAADQVELAKDALAEGQKAVTPTARRLLDEAVTQAENALERAKLDASRAKAAAATAITDAEAERSSAASAADTAASRLQQARDGTHPDTGQPPTPEELADLEAIDAEARRTLAAADAVLASARAEQPIIVKEQNLAVSMAGTAVEVAKAERTEQLAPADVGDLKSDVTDAQGALTEAQTDLDDAKSRVGAWLPTSEVVFLATVPRQVASVFADVGDSPTGPLMTISGADTVIESGISSADRRLVAVGDTATLEDDDLGIAVEAVVTFVADQPGGGGLSEDRYSMRLEATDEIPEDAINVNLRVAIPITSSGGDVLAVPLAALSAGADGTARVEVERAAGDTELVEVSTGLRAEGFVQIEPLEGNLAEGDRVVVGRDLILSGSDGADDAEADSDDEADG